MKSSIRFSAKSRLALVIQLLITFLASPVFLEAQHEGDQIPPGLSSAQEAVAMNTENDELLNGRVGPALIKSLAGRKLVPWEESAVHSDVVRTRIVLGSLSKRWSDDQLATILTLNQKSSNADTNPYVRLTMQGGRESFEAQLASKIRDSKGGLEPQDVLSMSLDVCKNDYWLATLTAYNLLKEVTYAERSDGLALTGYTGRKGGASSVLSRDIAKKLIDLRPYGDPQRLDRMGPWYHAFGLFFVGGIASGTDAQLMSEMENLTRLIKLGSPPDYYKERINTWAANQTSRMNEQVQKSSTGTAASAEPPAPPPQKPKPSNLPQAAGGGKGYWRFTGEHFIKGKPSRVGPNDPTSVDGNGGGSSMSAVCTSRDWRSSANFSWTASGDQAALKPGASIQFKATLKHSGDGAGLAGISMQPYGQEPGTGHVSGRSILAGFDNTVNTSVTRSAEFEVPEGPLYPEGRMEIRFEVYPGCATSAFYRTYEWVEDGAATATSSGWSGAWSTNFNRLVLSQKGTTVTGTYAHKNGRIEGTVQGDVLRGKWYQDNGTGTFEFHLASDQRSFKGRWGRGSTLAGGSWNGSRE